MPAVLLPVVRESNLHRTLIVGGGDWNSAAAPSLRVPAGERNLIATHYYEW